LTAVRLLWATADVRAEVFLIGEIVPAIYFWVRYDEETRFRWLLGGAVFTALALMTKGPFVLLPIGGGLLCDWIRRGRWWNVVHPKWLLGLALSLVFILPEMIALYRQFDAHPEKVVFGRTGVSGIRFFFWDSQVGRFFNSGPIVNTHGHPGFFVHTFAWAFLPWTPAAVAAVLYWLRARKQQPETERRPFVILSMSFLLTFVLFSLTKFQLDHYIDILLPFAAILAARTIVAWPDLPSWRWVCRFQIVLALVATLLVLGASLYAFRGTGWWWLSAFPVALLVFAWWKRRLPLPTRAILLPVLAVNVFFLFFVAANRLYFVRYDAGYQIARLLEDEPRLPLYDYRALSKSLAFHAPQPYANVDRLDRVPVGADVFVLSDTEREAEVLQALPGARVVTRATGTRKNSFSARMLSEAGWRRPLPPIHLTLVRTGGSTGR
jgi:4-amino-4-deoxy-L-arabinose transferase-like glycosyltransferase